MAPGDLSRRIRIGIVAVCVSARPTAAQITPLNPLELTRGINAGPLCMRRVVLGPCFCGPAPCGVQVAMYVPVAYVEVVRSAGDSIAGVAPDPIALPDAMGTVSTSDAGLNHTAEAHAWSVGDTAWTLAAQPACLQCKPSDARVPAPPPGMSASVDCSPAQDAVEALMHAGPSGANALLPSLAYASELDAVNWRTGCRDQLAPAEWLNPLENRLGSWGLLYPRQMRDLGTAQPVYAAKTAYRAMSIAREQLGTLAFPVDVAGRMQQSYPSVSECFAIGSPLSPQAFPGSQPAQVSPDGRYAWFYWRPTTCCIGEPSIARCGGGAGR